MTEKRKITITVAGETTTGKSAIMTIIEGALIEAGLMENEVEQISCDDEDQLPKAEAHRRLSKLFEDYPDDPYEIEIREMREMRTHPQPAEQTAEPPSEDDQMGQDVGRLQ